jgi:hypothetical protein
MNASHAFAATLRRHFRGEIDFIMRRSNTRAQLNDDITRLGAKPLRHLVQRAPGDVQFRPFAPRVNQRNRRSRWIDHINRAAIGHMNPEEKTSLIRNQAIATGELLVGRFRSINGHDVVSMHLLRGQQRPVACSQRLSDPPVRGVEARERLRLVLSDVNSGNTPNECAQANACRVQRRELLNRKSRCCSVGHLNLSGAALLVAGGVPVAAGVVDLPICRWRSQAIETLRVLAMRAGHAIEFCQGRVITKERL